MFALWVNRANPMLEITSYAADIACACHRGYRLDGAEPICAVIDRSRGARSATGESSDGSWNSAILDAQGEG